MTATHEVFRHDLVQCTLCDIINSCPLKSCRLNFVATNYSADERDYTPISFNNGPQKLFSFQSDLSTNRCARTGLQ